MKYLDPGLATAALSYVMGPMINALEDFGYVCDDDLVVASVLFVLLCGYL